MYFAQSPNALPIGHIRTIAGAGYTEGILATDADAGWPMGVARRPDGDLVVADYWAHCLWRIDCHGILHRFAGDGIAGNIGDGGPASAARFRHPHDLYQDQQGNLYLSDLGNYTIRRIEYATGIVTRVAGSGKRGRGGNGGLAVDAELDCTSGVAVDSVGHIYLSDEWSCNIRRVDAVTGIISLWAGLDARHYPSETARSRPAAGSWVSLMGYHGDGGPATEAAFHHPEHLTFDGVGDLYVCDNSNDRIRKIDQRTGIITTVLGNGLRSSSGDGGPAIEASTLMPDAICLDVHNNLYVGEKYGFRVRKVDARTGVVSTLVGNGIPGFGDEGQPGTEISCNSCEAGIWADPDGTVFWSDCSGRLRRYDGNTGIVTTALGGTGVGDHGPASNAFFAGPGGLCVGPNHHLYIADVWNQRIRAVSLHTGIISTVAGNGARAYGGDHGPATEAYLGNPHDVSVDTRGRIVIADTRHGHVRRVDDDGVVRNVAGAAFQWDKGDGGPAAGACLMHVTAVAHDARDNIYIGDAGCGRIRRIDAQTGIIDTVVGCGNPGYGGDHGPATAAQIGFPTAIRFDAESNLYFSDSQYHLIRKVNTLGIITTVAGCGRPGFSVDGTPAGNACLDSPFGLAVTATGGIYFSDSANHRVRTITPAGNLQTIVGDASPGDTNEGGSAQTAALNEPHGLCLYLEQILFISDRCNNKIKAVRINT